MDNEYVNKIKFDKDIEEAQEMLKNTDYESFKQKAEDILLGMEEIKDKIIEVLE